MSEQKTGYTFLLWNREEGEEANFVIRDNKTGKMTFFQPDQVKHIVWTTKDLTKDPSVKGWDTFGNETVDDLEDVIF